jgi:hypothetical protein
MMATRRSQRRRSVQGTAASTAPTRSPGVITRSRHRSSKSSGRTSAEHAETRSALRPEGQQPAEAVETVVCAYDSDEEEECGVLDWEDVLGDTPRFDFFFSSSTTTAEQRSLVYRAAVLFSTSLPSASGVDDAEIEDWLDSCQVSVDGCGGSGELEMAEAEEEEEEEEEEEQEATGGGGYHPPFQLVFPSAKRVSDFLAYLTHVAPHSIWSREQEREGAEGERRQQAEQPAGGSSCVYQPAVRLHWRMDLSDWIPAYC